MALVGLTLICACTRTSLPPIVEAKRVFVIVMENHSYEEALQGVYQQLPRARRLDQIAGIGVIAAVSIAARIGPIGRFARAEQLIAYAGLAPGVQQSDQTRREGRIGGGGTDRHLRHYLIEATVWARHIPRYRPAYERTSRRRGPKIGRLTVARLLLRSIWRMLRRGEEFQPVAATQAKENP